MKYYFTDNISNNKATLDFPTKISNKSNWEQIYHLEIIVKIIIIFTLLYIFLNLFLYDLFTGNL